MTARLIQPRLATPEDASDLATIHCAAWRETYSGLLPDAEIARACDMERRLAQWTKATADPDLRIAIVEGLGFACMGPQRDKDLLALGYPEELLAIYLLRKGQRSGLGTAMLRMIVGRPFSILVIAGNTPAIAFYQHIGAMFLLERPEKIGDTDIVELAFGWSPSGARDTPLAPRPTLR